MKNIMLLMSVLSLGFASDFFYKNGEKVFVEELNSLNNSKAIKEYVTENGEILKFKNELIVNCKKDSDCLSDIKKTGLTQVFKISKNFYFVKLDENQNIFNFSQKLYDLSSVKSAQPNFVKERVNR